MSPIAGQLVTEWCDYDGGRQVTAYVPAAAPEAIVFAGDGRLITSWGGVLEAADLPPTMIIGAHRSDDEMLRLHEYSPGESTAAFGFDLNGSPRMRRSSSRTCADGRGRGSTSRWRPTEPLCSASRRVPFFLENATRWADALRDAGADVVMTERVGSHGDAFWREEFPLMVAWAFTR